MCMRFLRRLALCAAMLVATIASSSVLPAPTLTTAAPTLNTPWVVLLCKYYDHPEEPQSITFFKNLFTASGMFTGNMVDYWYNVSYGQIDIRDSKVYGWYRMPYTYAQQLPKDRWTRTQDCVETAQQALLAAKNPDANHLEDYRIVAVVNDWTDGGAVGGRVLANPDGWGESWLAQEMGHAYMGGQHAWDRRYQCEYCNDWTVMGNGRRSFVFRAAFGYDDPRTRGRGNGWWADHAFDAGPGLTAPDLFRLGVLSTTGTARYFLDAPEARQHTRVITLAALNDDKNTSAKAGIPVAARIPFKGADGLEHSYMIEFRHQAGWDRNLPFDAVLMHEVRPNGIAFLVNDQGNAGGMDGAWTPGMTFSDAQAHLQVAIDSFDPVAHTARLRIIHEDLPEHAVWASGVHRQIFINGSNFTPNASIAVSVYGYDSDTPESGWVLIRRQTVISGGTCPVVPDGFCVPGMIGLTVKQLNDPCTPDTSIWATLPFDQLWIEAVDLSGADSTPAVTWGIVNCSESMPPR